MKTTLLAACAALALALACTPAAAISIRPGVSSGGNVAWSGITDVRLIETLVAGRYLIERCSAHVPMPRTEAAMTMLLHELVSRIGPTAASRVIVGGVREVMRSEQGFNPAGCKDVSLAF